MVDCENKNESNCANVPITSVRFRRSQARNCMRTYDITAQRNHSLRMTRVARIDSFNNVRTDHMRSFEGIRVVQYQSIEEYVWRYHKLRESLRQPICLFARPLDHRNPKPSIQSVLQSVR